MKNIFLILVGIVTLSACGLFGEDKPKEPRYVWVPGPVVHPVTGRKCSAGYCKGRPLKDDSDSGCNSAPDKCN